MIGRYSDLLSFLNAFPSCIGTVAMVCSNVSLLNIPERKVWRGFRAYSSGSVQDFHLIPF
jgi:hypothetical protein